MSKPNSYGNMRTIAYYLFLIILTVPEFLDAQIIYINEFMASNQAAIKDPDYGAYADWIELYNPGTQAVNLNNYSITDDIKLPQKFILSGNITIQPKQYLIIWADDQAKGVHTNFKLSATGEVIALFSPAGIVVDSITFGIQQTDVSYGRFPDGGPSLYSFFPSSPGKINLESSISNKLAKPVVSLQSGFYTAPVSVTVTHPEKNAILYFTRDGREPTKTDSVYKSAIRFDSTSILRVKAYSNGLLPSETLSFTYFINENNALPVFSLITDPVGFFSDTSGIYVAGTRGITGNCSTDPKNWNQDWERPVDLQLFEIDRAKGFHSNTGAKIFGGCSRIYPAKSLAFYYRGIYGQEQLQYRLFNDLPFTEYNNFVLRTSSQDWWRTMFRDGMVQTLFKQGMKIAYQEYRPSILFINGQYWGIHNIREKINEHYLFYHYGVDEANIDLVEISKGITADLGDITAYNNMITFLTNNNITLPANYEYIKSIVDIDDYIDYQLAEIYAANGDWPGSNMKLWRERSATGKWRWLIYDLDFTFGGNSQGMANTNTLAQATATNGPSWPNPPWATLMLRKLLENTEFRNEFIQRMAVHINTTFESAHVNGVIDSIKTLIASEIPRQKKRWTQSISIGNDWDVNIQVMRDFANTRPQYVRTHFISKFSLTGSYTLTLGTNNKEWGKLFIHNSEWTKDGGQGIFFSGIPLNVRAVALPGYRFVKWQGVSSSTAAKISIVAGQNSTLTAVFEPAPSTVSSLVINEINYKSSDFFNTEDWVELFNPTEAPINISGWKFYGSSNADFYQFKPGTQVEAKQYLVLSRDTAMFKSLWNNTTNLLGNIPFGLSSEGETITLKDNSDKVVDEVSYQPGGSWPAAAAGSGSTLALLNPQFDNSKTENWRASQKKGTPGFLNDVYFAGISKTETAPVEFMLCINYPNPFNPVTTIQYSIPVQSGSANVVLKVYDVLGKEIAVLVNEPQHSGFHEVTFDASGLSSGIYLYRLQYGSLSSVSKMVLLK